MTLPSSGAIAMSQVNTELGRSATAAISLGESAVRTLAGVSSGAISASHLRGKSSVAPPTISATSTGYGSVADMYYGSYYVDQVVTLTLGGTSPTTSAVMSGGTPSVFTLTKLSNTQYRVRHEDQQTGSWYYTTLVVTASNSAGSASTNVAIKLGSSYYSAG